MANLFNTAATNSLNEEDYINKLYDTNRDREKQLLADAFGSNTKALDTEKQNVQQQTQENLQRTDVEAQRVQQGYNPTNVSAGVAQQAALSMANQQRKNTGTLRDVQADADAEIERQRKLLGDQYASAIKQAQAENDMLRAQQLYQEARAKDEQFRQLRTEAGKLLAKKGDMSVLNSLMNAISAPESTGQTWNEVLKHEASINQIYDSSNEAERAKAESATAAILSQLQAQRDQNTRDTDRKLTDTYVKALREGKNADEYQTARGMGTGNRAQARLARELGTTEDLTALRGVQMGTDAAVGQKVAEAIRNQNSAVTSAVTANERKRAEALLEAAKNEEQALIDQQKVVGQQLAGQNDYSVLGKLYGLNQDQIDRLQGTGRYAPAPVYSYGGYGGGNPGGNPFEVDNPLADMVERLGIENTSNVVPASQSIANNIAISQKNAQNAANKGSSTSAAKPAASSSGANKSTTEKLLDILVNAAKKTYIGS